LRPHRTARAGVQRIGRPQSLPYTDAATSPGEAMPFELQGHRGARGQKPENTLPGFEAALDAQVTSLELDLHLTRDGIIVVTHDPRIGPQLARLVSGSASPDPVCIPLVSRLTRAELLGYRANRNPDPVGFPDQDALVTPAAALFAAERQQALYTPPALRDLFDFVRAYGGDLGLRAGKSAEQRAAAARVIFDVELKRVPFCRELIGDDFDGNQPGVLECRVVEELRAAGIVHRARCRSFDHRSVRAIVKLEPELMTGILVGDTAPVDPAALVRQAAAQTYCAAFHFVDRQLIDQLHAEGIRVLPFTVNNPDNWVRLLDWGIDGITTDYPERLARWLRARGVSY